VDPEFWHERWSRGEIGFHQHDFNAHMQAFTERLGVQPGATVLVPLCGKSRDMLWLRQQGFRVSGIEISARAIEDFCAENGLGCQSRPFPGGQEYRADGIQLFCADFFAIAPDHFPRIDAVYDRAALVALPPHMRPGYVDRLLSWLSPGVRILLVTLDYPQTEMKGPPFSVPLDEIDALFAGSAAIERLHTEDCLEREPRFREKGLTRLLEHVLLLERKSVTKGE